jgi:hypothetical protein
MNKSAGANARERYLSSLSPEDELVARRSAEETGIPENDPTWLLLSEVRRACQEANRCTAELKLTASEAAARIVRASASDTVSKTKDDALAERTAIAIGAQVAKNERVTEAVANAIREIERDAVRAMRGLETAIRDFMRRRAAAPAASMIFAFSLGVVSGCLSIWGTYHVAISYGQDLGYRAGFHDARLYDRSHQ